MRPVAMMKRLLQRNPLIIVMANPKMAIPNATMIGNFLYSISFTSMIRLVTFSSNFSAVLGKNFLMNQGISLIIRLLSRTAMPI